MSRPSSLRYHRGSDPVQANPGRRRPAPVARASASYTFSHAGRQLRLGPIAFWVIIGALLVMAAWTITTASYFAFREEVLTRLIAQQVEMQFGYEDRIAELRSRVDRISSRQLLDQEQYEQKLDQILRRQAALESRTSALGSFGEITGLIRSRAPSPSEPRASPPKPTPISDKGAALAPAGEPPLDPHASLFAKGAGGVGGMIVRVQASLDRVEQRQMATLDAIEDGYDSKARRIREILAELGIDVVKTATAGIGGPLVPAQMAQNGFDQQFHRINATRAQINRLTRTLRALPVRKPLDGDLELSSIFGVRSDPFTGSPALHTGLDLQGEQGDPVLTSADGRVTAAGWNGGYGRVVDINHGNGLSTRYAHLSAIEVRLGQSVKAGQVIGRIGSSGRSTGPHLHYETRIRGEAVDPHKFLRAGQRMQGSL
jgi:murein DD-endopeptidase MepM/ murein hydrolase activator NlpD